MTGSKGWRWTQADGFQFLERLSGGDLSRARAATWDGATAVGIAADAERNYAALWDESLGIRRLQDILENEYGLDLDGWHLVNANGISGDGTVIVGDGIGPSGRTQGWIVDLAIPEPGSYALVLGGLAWMLASRLGARRNS